MAMIAPIVNATAPARSQRGHRLVVVAWDGDLADVIGAEGASSFIVSGHLETGCSSTSLRVSSRLVARIVEVECVVAALMDIKQLQEET